MNVELVKNTKQGFIQKYYSEPLLVFSPGRINIIGDHTDYNNGYVLPAAIEKGIVSAISKSKNHFSSITALDANEQLEFSLDNIQPIKNGHWKNYALGVIAEIQKTGKSIKNFNLAFSGNLPIGAGLSSSAALENSIAFVLNELFQLKFSKKEMVFISQQAEHNFVGVKCGIMDQYIGMFGENKSALLLDCKSMEATLYKIDLSPYKIILINTNVKHSLAESSYNDRRKACERVAKILKRESLRDGNEDDLKILKDKIFDADYQKALFVFQENKRVLEAAKCIKDNDIESLGVLLYASHSGLRHQYKVSCEELDFLVKLEKQNPNVIGSRMMGGGFGGCTINIVKSSIIDEFTENIQNLYNNKFGNNCSIYNVSLSQGTHLITI